MKWLLMYGMHSTIMAGMFSISNEEWIMVVKLLVALALGGVIGIEREFSHRPAGWRTHILVCMGSCLFVAIWMDIGNMDSTARVAAAIATGLGFIGAGNIMAERMGVVHGITTAASIWITGAIGICVALGNYFLATVAAVLTVIVLRLTKYEKKMK